MKTKNHFKTIAILLITAWTLTSCSKNNASDDGPSLSSGFSMKVDGADWKSSMTTLFTEEHETSGMGEYFLVYISGSRIIEKNSNTEADLSETMGLYINIPASKFRNPKGTYPIIISEDKLGHAWGVFGSSTDIRDATLYVSGDPQNRDKTVGTLEIKGFEIGKQSLLGQGTEAEGYTKLSGTFHLDVYPMLGSGSKLKMTDGKFNLSGAINFGW